ncbi:MAG TPA: hypothetical protein VEY69_14155, partial [Lautropia sp.]|nr:hypothetical protein [Lautropia sp.]
PLADGDRFAVLFESLTSAVPPQLGPRDAVIHIGATPITPLSLPYAIPPTAPAAGRATAAPDAVG